MKKCKTLNCNKVGGLAECSEENPVNNMTIKLIANHCCVHVASHGVDCEIETKLSPEMIAYLTKLDELSPHQFTQVFEAADMKNQDILSC